MYLSMQINIHCSIAIVCNEFVIILIHLTENQFKTSKFYTRKDN